MRNSNFRGVVLLVTVCCTFSRAQQPKAKDDSQLFPVTVVEVDDLIRKSANLFDLEGKTIRFLPQKDGFWKIETTDSVTLDACDTPLTGNPGHPFGAHGWCVDLPFAFPFGGKHWTVIYVNNNGNVSFDKPENQYIDERKPWSDSGMRSMAAAIDSRSAAGREAMIAALWSVFDCSQTNVAIGKAADQVTVTWRANRRAGDLPAAGENVFQLRLAKSGIIECAYDKVAERDGIVGLFAGECPNSGLVHRWAPDGKASHPSVDLEAATIEDMGSVLRCSLLMRNKVPDTTDAGILEFRCGIERGGDERMFGVAVSSNQSGFSHSDTAPRVIGYTVADKRIDLYYSKVLLAGAKKFNAIWDVVLWGPEHHFVNSRGSLQPVALAETASGEVDLSAARGIYRGNVFEVFHYPLVTRNSETLLREVRRKVEAEDDLALVFTDFRFDDLFGGGDSSGPLNRPVKGIGECAEKPRSTKTTIGERLQVAIATQWVGAPVFSPVNNVAGNEWQNFGHGIWWVAHEWTHRWGMRLSYRDPETGQIERLADGVGHWLEGLHTPALIPVISHYMPTVPLGRSVMDGFVWHENRDGTYSKVDSRWGAPGGFSGLDLYAMGAIPESQVPDTFILRDLKRVGDNRYQGTKAIVRIKDVIAAMGPRIPLSTEEQKQFQLGVYLVHESGRGADPRMLLRAREFSAAVADFYKRATDGRISLIPSQSR